jgi:methyl-accepting chemotaxis protein
MASGAGQQAASIEEISASLEELSSQIQHNAENSFKAKQVSTVTSESAQKGIIVIEKMKDSINRIKSSSDETAKIVKTIDEIAFQTNLLALNAAVEAARAGEAGKGFAVVAEEVRNLAQRSAEAAKNTSALIMESQDNANSGVGVTEEVASIFLNISQDINKISALNEEVSQASSEQSSGIKQLSEGIHQIDSVTQSSAAQSEEIASSSEELASQANIFVGLVEKLLKMVKG